LLPIAFVGASALLVNGLVLVELPRPPMGGPATWAAIMSGLSLLLLPVLFGRASRAIDHAEILRTRAAKAAEEARRSVDQTLFDRIAYLLLVPICNDASVQLQALLPLSAQTGETFVHADQQGVVRDLNLYWLARLARMAADARAGGKSGEVTLAIRIGSRVGVGTTLLTLSRGMPPKATRMAQRVIKL
jgi:thymidine phosphorylase